MARINNKMPRILGQTAVLNTCNSSVKNAAQTSYWLSEVLRCPCVVVANNQDTSFTKATTASFRILTYKLLRQFSRHITSEVGTVHLSSLIHKNN